VSIRESFVLSAFKSESVHTGIGRFLAKAKALRGTVRGHTVSSQAVGVMLLLLLLQLLFLLLLHRH